MTEDEAAVAVAEWVDDTIELAEVYSYTVTEKGQLPDCVVDVVMKRTTMEDDAFPFSQLQNVALRVFAVTLSILVDGDTGNAEEQTETLRAFGAELEASLLADATLGGRVQMASPFAEFDYSGPFIQYPDGTRGRQLVVNMSVGELVSELDR